MANGTTNGPETIGEARTWGAEQLRAQDIEKPALTADLLLANCLDVPRLELPLLEEKPLTDEPFASYSALIEQRCAHRPLEYITGKAEFFGRSFHIDQRALIPRPETECMVQVVLNRLREQGGAISEDSGLSVCDLGTGSGVILHTICLEVGEMSGVGVDCSEEALQLAEKNLARHDLRGRIELLEGNFLGSVTQRRLQQYGPFDLVVSNPPYISPEEMAELEPEVKAFEPSRALIAPVERVQLYRTLCEVADQLTGPDGLFAMETAGEQELKSTFVRGHTSFESAGYERDHRGVDRIFVAQTA